MGGHLGKNGETNWNMKNIYYTYFLPLKQKQIENYDIL